MKYYNLILYVTIALLLISIFCIHKWYHSFLILVILLITYFLLFKVFNFTEFNKKEMNKYLHLFVGYTFLLYLHIVGAQQTTVYTEGYFVVASYYGKTGSRTNRFIYNYIDVRGDLQRAFINVSYDKYCSTMYPEQDQSGIIKSIIYITENDCYIHKEKPTVKDIEKFNYPVTVINRDIELGNDSYEYAKYERDIAYKYYGLNIVQIATSYDNNTIVFTKLNGEKDFISKKNNPTDTFLVYSNINPDFYDGWHIHSHSTKNIAKVKESGYGYLFRGKIYSAAETEKYWNIIEQYKLRN